MTSTSSQEASGLLDQSVPQWKRELIARRRALGRTLQVGSTTVKLTCPSVVAAVRQPEAVAAVENVIGKQQRCISSVAASNKSSLDQNQAGFHPGPSSVVSVAVDNMRLLDKCTNINNEILLNGSDIQNCKQSESEVSAFISSNMGEEKPVTNLKNASVSHKSTMEKISVKIHRKISIKKENHQSSRNDNDDGCMSDSSEELQYGPGIVNRLKTRYLSMTLRESQKKSLRPSLSSMRRATSLENMLDEDVTSNKITKTNNQSNFKNDNNSNVLSKISNISYRTKHTGPSRSSDSMKRARSMDTLLKADNRSTVLQNHANLRPKSLINDRPMSNGSTNTLVSIINEDLIIVESTSLDGVITSSDDQHELRFGRNLEERDLPPPDVVKQTLKFFETSPSRKSKAIQSRMPQNIKVSSNNSVSSLKGNSERQKNDLVYKPVLSPKPILSPEKLRPNRSNKISSPKKVGLQNTVTTAVLSPTRLSKSRDIEPLSLTNSNISSGSEVGLPTLIPPRTVSPRCVSPIVTVIAHSEQDQAILSPTSKANISNLNCKIESTLKNTNLNDDDDFDSSDEGESRMPKSVSQTALENIRKGGTSTQFKFNDNTQPTKIKSYLPGTKVHIQATNSVLVLSPTRQSSPPTATIAPLKLSDPLVSVPKQIGVIRPIVSTKIHPNIQSSSKSIPGLTEQEIEKNLINRVKSIEQPVNKVVVAIKSLPDNIVVGSVSSDIVDLDNSKGLSLPHINSSAETKIQGLWDKKPWHHNQNTMVFNFSNRKDVPDYIENDGLILKGQRDRPRPGEGGIILLDSGGEESSTDADSEEWISDPPSPCDVTFEGDNILINGKSNLSRQPKQRKLRIHFNDEATTMFEYPSEASLVDDDEPTTAKSSSVINTSSPAPSVPIGGTLGSYTPRQLGHGSGEPFQLGVTRSVPTNILHTSETTPASEPDDSHLKPAPPECTVAWSEGSAPDLLF